MAPRKPKNPVNDIINATSAWLGGNRGTVPSQVTRGMDVVRGIGGTLDAATGGFGRAVVSDAQSGSNTPSALYKTAAVNVAAAATGVAAARVAGKAVSAVGQSGVVKRSVQRTLKRDEVFFMHGSPKKGLKEIEPRLPPEATKIKGSSKGMFEGMEIDPLTWGTMVSHPSPIGKTKPVWKATKETLISRAEKAYEYTGPKMSPNYTGSLYIAKSPRKGVEDYGEEMITPSIAKVVREIRVAGKSREQVYEEALKELKGLGMKIPKSRGGGKNKR